MLTQELLKTKLDYDPEIGKFIAKVRTKRRLEGEPVETYVVSRGYKRAKVYIAGKQYPAERLAFLYVTGAWPVAMVDHLNHDTVDNRFSNLRDVTNQQNQFNQVKAHKGSTTGFLGVSFFRRTGRYQARITLDKRQMHLGYFDTPEQAYEAYKTAKRLHHDIVL